MKKQKFLVRKVVVNTPCRRCGQPAKFQYGWEADQRPGQVAFSRSFCSKFCYLAHSILRPRNKMTNETFDKMVKYFKWRTAQAQKNRDKKDQHKILGTYYDGLVKAYKECSDILKINKYGPSSEEPGRAKQPGIACCQEVKTNEQNKKTRC